MIKRVRLDFGREVWNRQSTTCWDAVSARPDRPPRRRPTDGPVCAYFNGASIVFLTRCSSRAMTTLTLAGNPALVTVPSLKAEGSEYATDEVLHMQTDGHELLACRHQRANSLALNRLYMHVLVQAGAGELGQAARVVLVGLDALRLMVALAWRASMHTTGKPDAFRP